MASFGPGDSGPYLGIIGHGSTTWPAGWPHLELVSGIVTWGSPIPGDSGPHVGLLDLVILVLTWSSPNLGSWSSPGPHLDKVNLVPIWASPSPVYFVPHLDLIAVDSFFASPGTGDSGTSLGLTLTW